MTLAFATHQCFHSVFTCSVTPRLIGGSLTSGWEIGQVRPRPEGSMLAICMVISIIVTRWMGRRAVCFFGKMRSTRVNMFCMMRTTMMDCMMFERPCMLYEVFVIDCCIILQYIFLHLLSVSLWRLRLDIQMIDGKVVTGPTALTATDHTSKPSLSARRLQFWRLWQPHLFSLGPALISSVFLLLDFFFLFSFLDFSFGTFVVHFFGAFLSSFSHEPSSSGLSVVNNTWHRAVDKAWICSGEVF